MRWTIAAVRNEKIIVFIFRSGSRTSIYKSPHFQLETKPTKVGFSKRKLLSISSTAANETKHRIFRGLVVLTHQFSNSREQSRLKLA